MEMLKNIIIIMRYITGINTSNPDLEANKNSFTYISNKTIHNQP